MKKLIIIAILTALTATFVPVAYAQDAESLASIPEHMLTDEQKEFLSQQEVKAKVKERVGDINEYYEMGKEVGAAMEGVLVGLAEATGIVIDNVDDLAETKVGKFAMIMAAFHIMGADLIQLGVGGLLWIIGTCVFIWVFKNNYLVRAVNLGDKKNPNYQLHKPRHQAVAGVAYTYLAFNVVCALIVLV